MKTTPQKTEWKFPIAWFQSLQLSLNKKNTIFLLHTQWLKRKSFQLSFLLVLFFGNGKLTKSIEKIGFGARKFFNKKKLFLLWFSLSHFSKFFSHFLSFDFHAATAEYKEKDYFHVGVKDDWEEAKQNESLHLLKVYCKESSTLWKSYKPVYAFYRNWS